MLDLFKIPKSFEETQTKTQFLFTISCPKIVYIVWCKNEKFINFEGNKLVVKNCAC